MSDLSYLEQLQDEYQNNPSEELRNEILSELRKQGEVFDPETAHQDHIWIDRGAKLTCENAGHIAHEIWKRR